MVIALIVIDNDRDIITLTVMRNEHVNIYDTVHLHLPDWSNSISLNLICLHVHLIIYMQHVSVEWLEWSNQRLFLIKLYKYLRGSFAITDISYLSVIMFFCVHSTELFICNVWGIFRYIFLEGLSRVSSICHSNHSFPFQSVVRTHGSQCEWRTTHSHVKFAFYKSQSLRRNWRTHSLVRAQCW